VNENPPLTTEVVWDGGLRFRASGASGVGVGVDGEGKAGPSPMETLLASLGSCAGTDVADILRKGRQDFRSLTIRLRGDRRAEPPRSFVRIAVEVELRGRIERAKAERAVQLAFDKYCSVRASLDPAIPLDISLRLDAEGAEPLAE
jgi:putative redox protein